MSEPKKIAKGKQAFLLMVGKILALGVTFFVPVFLSRFLTVAEYGCYAQFNALCVFLIAVFSFGVQNNLYYFYPRLPQEKQRSLIFNSLFSLLGGAAAIFILLSVPFFRNILIGQGDLSSYCAFIVIYIFFFMPSELLEPFYVVSRDVKTSLWFPAIRTLGKVAMIVIFAMLFGGLKSIFSAMISFEVAIFTLAIVYYFCKTRVPTKIKLFDPDLLAKQWKYIFPFGCSVVLFTLAGQFDKLLCIKFLTTSEYALYAVAFFAIPGITQIYSSVGNVYLINMSEAFIKGDKNEVRRLFHELTCKIFAFSFPLILGVCLYADCFITLVFSSKYLQSVPYFQVHIFAFCFTMLGAGLIIRASGKTQYSFYAYLYSCFLTLPATYFGIRYWGIWGGITMSMFSQFLPKIFQMIFEIKILSISLADYMPWKKFCKIALLSFTVLFPFFFLRRLIGHNMFFSIVCGVVYLLTIYCWLLYLNLFIIDRNFIQTKYRSLVGKVFRT